MSSLNLVTIGYAKGALKKNSREFQRFLGYAKELGSLDMVVLTKRQDGLPTYVEADKLRVYGTNSHTRLGSLWRAYRIVSQVIGKSHRKDFTVSSQDPFETGLVAWLLSKRLKADFHVQVHGDFFGNSYWLTASPLNRWRQRLGQWLIKKANRVRVVSLRIKQSLLELGVESQKIVLLPVGFSLKPFLTVGEERRYKNSSDLHFLYVGRLAPEKNLASLLKAFALIQPQHQNTRLTLVGDGPESLKLRELVGQLDLKETVSFVPWTENVPKVMKEADVLVLTSYHEGFGLVILEAMAAGLPVVTTDVGCVGEFLTNGEEGIVVGTEPQAIAAGLLAYVRHPNRVQVYGQKGWNRAKKLDLTEESYTKQWRDSF